MQLVSVVITCHGEAKDLPVMLGSLARQREYFTRPCPRTGNMVKWVAGRQCELPIDVVCTWDGEIPDSVVTFPFRKSEITFVSTPKETRLENAGHHTRAPGITKAKGQWIVLTNMDNYFVQGWRHRIEPFLAAPGTGMVYWDVLNNLWVWSNYGGTKINQRGYADLSCCAIRADICDQVGFPWRGYDDDYTYIQTCLIEMKKQGLRPLGIGETLSVHN